MTPATPPGGRRTGAAEPTRGPAVPVADPRPKPEHPAVDTVKVTAADTLRHKSGAIERSAADSRSGPMPRADLVAVVKGIRDERGRLHDTAAHLLLTEVACCLEWDARAARADLLSRLRALREERSRTKDPVLMLLLAEVIPALECDPATDADPAGGFCEFCGNAGGGCAVCGGQ